MAHKVHVNTERVQHPDTLAVGRDAVLYVDGKSFMRCSCGDTDADFFAARRYLLDSWTFFHANRYDKRRTN